MTDISVDLPSMYGVYYKITLKKKKKKRLLEEEKKKRMKEMTFVHLYNSYPACQLLATLIIKYSE